MAIAGALQVNTMLEELDLAETDQVIYMCPLQVKWPSCRLTAKDCRCFIKGWAPSKLTGCEYDFAHLA